MASLIPDFGNPSVDTGGAMRNYLAATQAVNEALQAPVTLLSKLNDAEIAQKRYDEEKALRAEELGWKRDERARDQQERAALDKYFGVISQGEQTVGGALNTDAVIGEANKYAFTPEESAKYDIFKGDASAARSAGEVGLANKIDWQTKLSDAATELPTSGVANEGRVAMYERALSGIIGAGLPVSKEMVASLDAARLAEAEAKKTKLAELNKQQESIDKDNLSMLKFAIQNTGSNGGSNVVDDEGNVIGTTSAQNKRELKLGDKYAEKMASGQQMIQEEVKKQKATGKGTAESDALIAYNELLKRDPSIDPKSAAGAIIAGISASEGGWFSSPEVRFSKDTLDQTAKSLSGTLAQTDDAGVVSGGGANLKSLRADALAEAVSKGSEAKLSKILSDKAALLRDDKSTTNDSVNTWLRDRGVLEKPAAVVSSGVTTSNGSGTLADRNNNPGNLTGDDKWQGMVGKDGRFIQFQSYEMGSRALAKNLMNGAVGKTVEDYMAKYAPKSENDTNSYIKHVSSAIGKKPGDVITNQDILPLMKVIAKYEGGKVDNNKLEAGYRLATEFQGKDVSSIGTKPADGTSVKEVKTGVEDVDYLINKFNTLKNKPIGIKQTDPLFKLSNLVGMGEPRYSSKDQADFAQEVRTNKKDMAALLTPDNLKKVDATIDSLTGNIKAVDSKLVDVVKTRDSLMNELKSTGKVDGKKLQEVNKELSTLTAEKNKYVGPLDELTRIHSDMLNTSLNGGATNTLKNAINVRKEQNRKAYDPTLSEALTETALTGLAYAGVPSGKVGYNVLSSVAPKVSDDVVKAANKLPTILNSGKTVTESAFKNKVKGADTVAELGRLFSNPKLATDVKAQDELLGIAIKYPEFADDILKQFEKLGINRP